MDDNELRAYYIGQIAKKEEEWDRYSKKYAGVPEYWQVQQNAFNEISSLKAELAKLPPQWGVAKIAIVFLIIISVVVGLIYYVVTSFSFSNLSNYSCLLKWIYIALILTFLCCVYEGLDSYFEHGIKFDFYSSLYDVYTKKTYYVFYGLLFSSLIACNYFVDYLSIWPSSVWISWGLISLGAAVVISVILSVLRHNVLLTSFLKLKAIPVFALITFICFMSFKLFN